MPKQQKRVLYIKLLSSLEKELQDFTSEVNNKNLQNLATDKWSVKDVLCHIVFWHKYYAQNYASLAAKKEPFIFTSRGGSTRNQEGVNSLKKIPKEELLKMLQKAQQSLRKSIIEHNVPEMSYTDRKKYKTEDFLVEITRHINRHSIQVRKAKQAT